MNLYKLLIYIYFVFNECQFIVLENNSTCTNDKFICFNKDCLCTNNTMLNDILQTTRNSTRILKKYINELKNEINNNEKKIGDIEDKLIKIEKNSNNLKNEINNNEKKIDSLEDQLINNIKKIENITSYLKTELDTIRNYLVKENNLIKDSLISLKFFVANETNLLKIDLLNWLETRKINETIKSRKTIDQLSNKLFICILVIAIILIIVLLAEVRFKIITKIIQRWSGTNRVNENCHDLSENSNNPLLDSRKSDSLKYELQKIKGEMNRIENVLLTTNTYALSELNNKIEKFYSDLDVQFQSFVKDANETIAKIKHEFVLQCESE